MTPLLSDSLRDCIKTIMIKHNSKIAEDLYIADKYIETLRSLESNTWTIGTENFEFIKEAVQNLIDALITDEVRALSIRKDVFEISFTPKGKELIYSSNNNWSRENRQTGKPGRIIKKLLVFDYKERDIEIFNNLLKSEIMSTGDFRIVSGIDICDWYNSENYYKIAGTLGNSCMRYSECSCYFNIYQDCAKLLTCIKDDKLLGRAVIWEIDGQTYMDRVYTCMDYLEEQFYQYAMDNKWVIRSNNALLYDGDSMEWLMPTSSYKTPVQLNLTIHLPEVYSKFPYMDSFRYLIVEKAIVTDCVPERGTKFVELSNTDGYWGAPETFCCCNCGAEFTGEDYDEVSDDIQWSEYMEAYYCNDCCFYNDYMEDYLPNDIEVLEVYDRSGILEVPRFEIERYSWNANIHYDGFETRFVQIDDKWYTLSSLTWNNKLNRYDTN